jgi:hypothetical protein
MKTSFFLTPDLKDRAVNLAFRDANGTLHPWANQIEIIEQDHTKGIQKTLLVLLVLREGGLIFALLSSYSSRINRVVFLYEGLPQAPPSLDADPW